MKRIFVLLTAVFIISSLAFAQPTSAPRLDGIYKRELLGTREVIPTTTFVKPMCFGKKESGGI